MFSKIQILDGASVKIPFLGWIQQSWRIIWWAFGFFIPRETLVAVKKKWVNRRSCQKICRGENGRAGGARVKFAICNILLIIFVIIIYYIKNIIS